MTNSFLILSITIKVEISLILQGVSINTHSALTKKKSIYFSNSFPSPPPHTPPFLSLFKKKHIEGDRNKSEKKILYTSLILSHHHSHIHTSFFISISKQKKHIGGGRKNKRKK